MAKYARAGMFVVLLLSGAGLVAPSHLLPRWNHGERSGD
jgi:hypothetical protein